jgi:hypothetical protein
MPNRTDVIPVQFEDGTIIQIQATMLGGEEEVAAFKGGVAFEGVMKPIKKIADEVAKLFKEIQPDKAVVQMGFEIATGEGQLTALLVKGTATANLTVTLEWVKEKKASKARRGRKV